MTTLFFLGEIPLHPAAEPLRSKSVLGKGLRKNNDIENER